MEKHPRTQRRGTQRQLDNSLRKELSEKSQCTQVVENMALKEREKVVTKCRTLKMEKNKSEVELKQCKSLLDGNPLLQSKILKVNPEVSFECSSASSSSYQYDSSYKTSEAVSFSKKDTTCMTKEFQISTVEQSNINGNVSKSFPSTSQSESAFADEMFQHSEGDGKLLVMDDLCDAEVQSNTTKAQLQNCATVAQTRPCHVKGIIESCFESLSNSSNEERVEGLCRLLSIMRDLLRSYRESYATPSSSVSCTTQNPITNCNQLETSSVTHIGKVAQCGIATSRAAAGCFVNQKQSFVKKSHVNGNKVTKKFKSKKSKRKTPQLKVEKKKKTLKPSEIYLPVKKHLYDVLGSLESLYTNADLYGNFLLDIQHSLCNQSTVSSTKFASDVIIAHLLSSELNPLLSYLNSSATTDLTPLPERCIVEASVLVDQKLYPHLNGLLETLMQKLQYNATQSHMFDVFAASAICRVYIMFCRLENNFQEARSLVHALLQSSRDSSRYIIASVAGVWPHVLESAHDVEFIDAAIKYVLLQKPEGLTEEMWKQCFAVFQMCNITSVSELNMAQKAIGVVKFFSSNKNEEAKKECEQILRLFISKIGFSWVQDTFVSAISNCIAQCDTKEQQEEDLYNLIEFIDFLNEFSENNSFEAAVGKQLSHVMDETTVSS